MTLTAKQRSLRKEIEDIASLIRMDHWQIEKYRHRTDFLKGIKDKLVRGEIVSKYTVIDEYLTMIICDYYFPRALDEYTYRNAWKNKRFVIFNHRIMEELSLLKKLDIVNEIDEVPKGEANIIRRINDLRNALAHSLFPENRRRYMQSRKVLYQKIDIFTPAGIAKFEQEYQLVDDYLAMRLGLYHRYSSQ